MFHEVSASAALQTMLEMFLHATRSCAFNLICSRSSFFLIYDIGNDISVNLALAISLFNIVTIDVCL